MGRSNQIHVILWLTFVSEYCVHPSTLTLEWRQDPAVYPYFKIYPSVSRSLTESPLKPSTRAVTFFGLFLNIVESEYDARRILKTRSGTQHSESVEEPKNLDLSVRLRPVYPTIEICKSFGASLWLPFVQNPRRPVSLSIPSDLSGYLGSIQQSGSFLTFI
jgi:hypothetical protein